MELFLHKGVSTHSEGKYATSLRDMTKMSHLGVAKPQWGKHPIFGFAPKAEPFSLIPNHEVIRLYSLRLHRAAISFRRLLHSVYHRQKSTPGTSLIRFGRLRFIVSLKPRLQSVAGWKCVGFPVLTMQEY